MRRCGPRCCAAPRRPKTPAPRAQSANRSPDSPPATPRCPAGRSRPASSLRASPAAAACTDAAALLRCAAASDDAHDACPTRKPFSSDFSLATGHRPAGRSRPTFVLRPSPATSRGVVARHVVIAPCGTPHRVARSSLSRPAVCKDAARAVAPRHGVPRSPRRVPSSQIVLPILRRQRVAARPADLAPRLLCVRRP